MTNTSKYIPYKSVAQNMLITDDFPDFPFFNGTGFFVIFPPYDYIFYVTAKHCLIDAKTNDFKGDLILSYTTEKSSENEKAIKFTKFIFPHYIDSKEEEDLIIAIVSDDIEKDKKEMLRNRALRLQHQEDIDNILNILCQEKENIRVVGFPKSSQEIDYEKNLAVHQPRGFYGKIKDNARSKFYYGFEEASWKEGDFNGFSGSPVLAIMPLYSPEDSDLKISAIVIGVLLTFSNERGEFVSINCVTNTVAEYIKEQLILHPINEVDSSSIA